MPSKKQRRRREKTFRHDYVWEDAEGNAAERLVELKPEVKKERPAKASGSPGRRRTGRTIEPASWRRVGKRAAIFAPLMFVAVSVLDKKLSATTHAAQTIVLLAFFLPFSYVMDTVAYRMYLRRTGQAPPSPKSAAPKDR